MKVLKYIGGGPIALKKKGGGDKAGGGQWIGHGLAWACSITSSSPTSISLNSWDDAAYLKFHKGVNRFRSEEGRNLNLPENILPSRCFSFDINQSKSSKIRKRLVHVENVNVANMALYNTVHNLSSVLSATPSWSSVSRWETHLILKQNFSEIFRFLQAEM